MSANAPTPQAPARPHLVLNVAVAGARKIPDVAESGLDAKIGEVLAAIESTLASLKATADLRTYYASTKPLLRIVSGLADGADLRVAEVVRRRHATAPIAYELGAVFPFPRDIYRDRSPITNQERFNALLKECRWVQELDGHYVSDPEDRDEAKLSFAKRSRARGYRAQGEILLRQCDVLIAVSDPAEAGRAGGTRETLVHAVALRIPVVYIALTNGLPVSFIAKRSDLDDLAYALPSGNGLEKLQSAIGQIVAAPLGAPAHHKAAEHKDEDGELAGERAFLDEFFTPRVATTFGQRLVRFRDRCLQSLWRGIDAWLERNRRKDEPATRKLPPSPSIPPSLKAYRDRASSLNQHYAGLYRGAFFLNYALAVLAVFLASLGLLIFLWPEDPAYKEARIWALFAIVAFKLAILCVILWTTRAANNNRWNEKAVDYRYVAERLRAMSFLPHLATLRPPPPSVRRVKPERVQQTIADWLAMAAIRSTDMAEMAPANAPLNPAGMLSLVNENWLQGQVDYHERNTRKMKFLAEWLEEWAQTLSIAVILVVALDIILLILKATHAVHGAAEDIVVALSLALMFTAVILPAAVAGANGIRFQSECDRLADRSEVFKLIVADMQREASELQKTIEDARIKGDPGAWVAPVALFTERCAQLFVDEVAEWSVLYAKELRDA